MDFLSNFILLLALIVNGVEANSTIENKKHCENKVENYDQYIKNNNLNFSLQLFNSFQNRHENLFFSTASLLSTIETILKFYKEDENDEENRLKFINLLECSRKQGYRSKSGNFVIVNRIWVDKSVKLLSENKNIEKDIEKINILDNINTAVETINAWVKNKTNGGITELVNKNDIDKSTYLMVTNAIHFKAAWKFPFDSLLSSTQKFSVSKSKKIEVNMMQNTLHTKYYLGEDVKMLEIPYKDNEFVMDIFITDTLSNEKIEESLKKALFGKVKILIPKFSLESKNDMMPHLQKLGYGKDIFSKDIKILEPVSKFGNIFHDAKIIVNEVGTEASAGTAAINGRSIVPLFKVDQPFYFMIRDQKFTQVILFGKVTNPSKKTDVSKA